jgi:hypothetical protein
MWRSILACTESNLADSGSNSHQFQGIVTSEFQDDTIDAAPEIQPMNLTVLWPLGG